MIRIDQNMMGPLLGPEKTTGIMDGISITNDPEKDIETRVFVDLPNRQLIVDQLVLGLVNRSYETLTKASSIPAKTRQALIDLGAKGVSNDSY